jgi:hypothetical protein
MSADSQIRINALLLQREALFVRVHEIEGAVSALLGEPYPFTRPALPSDQRVKRKAPARAAAAGAKDKLRKLEPDETGYRVTYRQQGQIRVETHDSPDALRTLLASQSAQLEVQLIETIDATGTTKVVLHGTA